MWNALRILVAAPVMLVMLSLPGSANAATPEQVDATLKKAKDYLYSRLQKDNWEAVEKPDPKFGAPSDIHYRQWGGLTAMAVYGLLASGENPQDKRIAPAIEWLKKAPMMGHYAIGVRCQVWTFLPEKEARQLSQKDFETLRHALLQTPRYAGFYSYYTDEKGRPQQRWCDLSVSQYGVLGMWACEQTGQEVPNSYWQQVDEAWRKAQRPDGGWPYKLDEKDTRATMTAAGVASLFITQDYLLSNNTSLWATCKGGIRNDNIDKGMAYLDKHVAGILKGNHYGMYGIERIGVASGHKYIGGADWYRVGAQFLVESQNEDGSFDKHVDPNNFNAIPTTVFSMVFLARGRAPVIMNKLEYELAAGPDGKKILDPWNQRPRDVANFAHWSGKQIERYLNWQVVNLKVSPDDLHDAPILYIAGSEPLAFGDTEIKKLREFVDDGGLILGNAECSSQAFTKSFVALGKKLFPRYEFRELPLNHPIYADQQFRPAKWKSRPQVDALSNGVRELMILIPDADASRAWQTRSEKTKEEIYQLVQDIFLYAVDKANLRERGQTYIVRADPKISTDHNVKVVRLIVGDNPDPEPGGWNRLAAILRNQYKVNLTVASAAPGEGKLTGAKIAHLTGTTRFKLNAAQQREIKDFVARGGTLVVDAAGGKSEFADSAEAELALMFGGVANNIGVILEPDHEVYTLSGSKIHRFDYRNFVKGKISGKLNVPRVRGIEQAGRVEVFYSREDLSAGLVGQPMDGILGYDPNTATQIMRNIILYCAGGNLKPVIAEGAANASVAK